MLGHRRVFEIETSKPKSVRATLGRFWGQFRGYRLLLAGVLVLAMFSAWSQVITPDLIGQTVDCYLTPYGQGQLGDFPGAASAAQSNC